MKFATSTFTAEVQDRTTHITVDRAIMTQTYYFVREFIITKEEYVLEWRTTQWVLLSEREGRNILMAERLTKLPS